MQVEYEGMANDYTVTPVDDPEGIWSFCKFIMGPAKAAIFSRPEFAHTSEQHIVCGNKDFNGYPHSPIAAGTFGIWFTVVESRLNEVQGVLEDIACRKTADCTSAVLRGRLRGCGHFVATQPAHGSPIHILWQPDRGVGIPWLVCSPLPGVATDHRTVCTHRGSVTFYCQARHRGRLEDATQACKPEPARLVRLQRIGGLRVRVDGADRRRVHDARGQLHHHRRTVL